MLVRGVGEIVEVGLGHNGGCKGRSEVDGNGNGDGKKPRKGCSGWLKGEGGEGIREGKGVGCVVEREGFELAGTITQP